MPVNYKVLGQSNPSATTVTTLYTVPSATQAVVSTIAVANQAASSGTYRIIIQQAADVASVVAKQYIAYDSAITANNSTMITIGVTLAASDVIKVYASSATMSFQAFGTEIS